MEMSKIMQRRIAPKVLRGITSISMGVQGSTSSSKSLFATKTTMTSKMSPEVDQEYRLINRRQISPNTCHLQFALPAGRKILGWNKTLPTCIRVEMPGGTDVYGTGTPPSTKTLHKSYSPISHPSTENSFDLVVKAYPFRKGGGVGSYLCSLAVRSSIVASVKSPRLIHGEANIYGRWKNVGLIAGGTGIAPLFQIATMLLNDPLEFTKNIHLLFINRYEVDILLHQEIDSLKEKYSDRFHVTYSLTSPEEEFKPYEFGRGSIDMISKSLPPAGPGSTTMVFVCGKDEFVKWWGGSVQREIKADGSKGGKIQGPLLGLLKQAGFHESQVYKY